MKARRSQGPAVDISQHDVRQSRFDGHKYLPKLSGLVVLLVVTLCLIGVLELANRKLPNGSQSHFDPIHSGTNAQSHSSTATSSGQQTLEVTKTAALNRRGPSDSATNGTIATVVPITALPSFVTASSTPSSASPLVTNDSLPPSDTTTLPPSNALHIGEPPSSTTQNNTSDSSSISIIETYTTAATSSNATLFVPISSSLTLASVACSPSAASSAGCTCPYDNEVPNCRCQPDPSTRVCACTYSFDPLTNSYSRDCVCPPDSCTFCQCPADALGGSSRLTSCDCPADPVAAGCSCRYSRSGPGTSSESGCTVIQQCNCGVAVRAAQCSSSQTLSPGLSVATVTMNSTTSNSPLTAPIANTTAFVPLANQTVAVYSTSSTVISSTMIISTTIIGPSNFSSTTIITSTTSSTVPVIVSSLSVSSNISSTAVIAPALTSPVPSSTRSPPPGTVSSVSTQSASAAVAIPFVSLSTSFIASDQASVLAVTVSQFLSPAAPIAGPIIGTGTLASPQGSTVPTAQETVAPLVSPSPTNARGQPDSIPITIPPGPEYIVSVSTTTNSLGRTVALSVVFRPAVPTISQSSSTNPQGKIVPIRLTVSSPLIPVTTLGLTHGQGQPAFTPATSTPTANPPVILSTSTDSSGSPVVIPVTPQPTSAISPGVAFFISTSLSTNADGSVMPSQVTFLEVQLTSQLPFVTGPAGQEYTIPPQFFSSTSDAPQQTSQPGSGSSGGGGSGNGKNPNGDGPVKVAVYSWSKGKTFYGGYLPVIIAKGYQLAWAAVFLSTKDMAPFSQLSSPTGATGAQLFSSMDLSSWFAFVPFAVSWVMVPFASDSIYFDTNYGCSNPNAGNPTNPCWPPRMTANTWVIRLLQSFLALMAAVTVALIVFWWKKPTSRAQDPTSIAAVAAIAGHPEVVRDFTVPAETTSGELKALLKDKRYSLAEYESQAKVTRYGLVPIQADDNSARQQTQAAQSVAGGSQWGFLSWLKDWKKAATLQGVVFLGYLLGLLILVAIYLSDINDAALMNLFSGSSVGKRILFAVLAAIVCMNLSRIERDMQTLTPYMRLSSVSEPPEPTILLRKHTTALTSFVPLLLNKHFTASVVAFAAILSEFLVITLSGLPYRPGQLRSEFLFCAISSLAILLIVFVVVGTLSIWWHFLPNLPRKPTSVANTMTYVCQSEMVKDFEGLERLNIKERDQAIKALGKRYGYIERTDSDGSRRWRVDEVGTAEVQKNVGNEKYAGSITGNGREFYGEAV